MRKITKKHLKIIIPVILVVALVIGFIMWATAPKKGKIQNSSSAQKTTTGYTQKELDGTNVAFTYSSKYLAKTEGASNNDLEIHTLSAATQYDKRIIVSVSKLPDGQLSSHGNYIYRQVSNTVYTPRKVQIAGTTQDVWVKDDGSEQTVFIPRGNKVATITFTTAQSNEDLTSEINEFMKTFRWKQ